MAKATQGKEKIRLTLDISPETNEVIEGLAQSIGCSKSDVLRKAVSLLAIANEAKLAGRKFGIAEKDQPLATEIIGI